MKIVKELITKYHQYEEDGTHSILVEEIQQYHYSNEKEKLSHSRIMQNSGWEDNGQSKTNIGTIMNPIHIWFGSYTRYRKEEGTNICKTPSV